MQHNLLTKKERELISKVIDKTDLDITTFKITVTDVLPEQRVKQLGNMSDAFTEYLEWLEYPESFTVSSANNVDGRFCNIKEMLMSEFDYTEEEINEILSTRS